MNRNLEKPKFNINMPLADRMDYTIAAAKIVGPFTGDKDDEQSRIEYYVKVATQASMMIQSRHMLDRMLMEPQSPAKDKSGSYRVG